MKTERELFELLKKNAIQNILSVSGKSKTTEVIGEEFDKLFDVISASREGYKIVPVEPTKEMLIAADNCVIDGKVTSHNIYKAMIEAVEK